MPSFTYMLNSFKAGELGPKTHARTETEQYKEGLDSLENFLVETSGGAFRRGGFVNVDFTGNAEGEYISFVYKIDRESIYQIDLKVTATVSATISQVNANSTPRYTAGTVGLVGRVGTNIINGATDIYGFSYIQVDGCLVLVHSNGEVEPTIFVPTLNGAGELCLVAFPWLDQVDDATIAGAVVGTPTKILLDYSSWTRYDEIVRTPLDNPNVTPITMALGAVTGSTTLVCSSDFFVSDMASDAGVFNGLRVLIDDGTGKSLVGVITAVTDAQNATAEIISTTVGFSLTASNYWYISAWDKYNGWPKTVELHDGRLVFGGSKTKPATLWASFPFFYGQLNRYYAVDIASAYVYTRTPSTVEGGVEYSLASEGDQEEIAWLKSNRSLLLGTTSREYAIILSPTSPSLTPQSNHGGDIRTAVNAYNSTYFIGVNGQDIYEAKYSEENGAFVSRRITDSNDQIIHDDNINKRTRYVQLVYVEEHKSIFALTDSFKLVAISIDPRTNILAFSKIKMSQTQHRYIWKAFDDYENESFLFTRTVHTGARGVFDSQEWILKLMSQWDDIGPVSDTVDRLTDEAIFVDYATYGTNGPASASIALGAEYGNLFVSVLARTELGVLKIYESVGADPSGNITVDDSVTYWVAGLAYSSKLITLTPEVGPNQILNSQGDVIRIDRVTAKLYDSWVGKYGSSDTQYDFEVFGDGVASALAPYNGEVRLDVPLGPDDENKIKIETDKPLPLNVLGLIMRGQNNP
jgi:hypothetical protein